MRATRSGRMPAPADMEVVKESSSNRPEKRTFGRDITNVTNAAVASSKVTKTVSKPTVFHVLEDEVTNERVKESKDLDKDDRDYMRRPAGKWKCNFSTSVSLCALF